MTEIRWSPRSLLDIKRLYDFIAEKNPKAASNAITGIRVAINNLITFPELGKTIENLPPNYREINIPFGARGYIARYYLDENTVTIIAIRHYLEVYF